MNFTIGLTINDWKSFQRYMQKTVSKSKKQSTGSLIITFFTWVALGFIFMAIFSNIGKFHWPTACFVSLIFISVIAFYIVMFLKMQKALLPSENGSFIGQHKFVFDQSGIKSSRAGYELSQSWNAIISIVRSGGYIYLFTDTINAYIFPEAQLENVDEFYKYVCNQQKT